ncbi:MAG: hypothetical protein Aurels2KO_16630 [Aureliella sp.]
MSQPSDSDSSTHLSADDALVPPKRSLETRKQADTPQDGPDATVAFDGNKFTGNAGESPTESLPPIQALGDASQNANTVISNRPVAAPEEFYRSMPLAELAEMLEGRQLDHFAVEQMIGGGGMGAVFRGRDMRLDRVVAIKVIPASKRDPETLRRFRLEAQAAARLDHPNIARVFYVGEAERWNYIVFEFIDGVNMRDLVDMEGPLSIDDAIYYTRQVAEALEHANSRDVVHRDIKPSNILITSSGQAKVVDMGLARDTSMDKSAADETASGVTLGTFDYISPEQARNPRDADVRSDLYSLGCSLFFMLTGNPPFPEGTALQKLLNHGSQPPPDTSNWRDDVSDQLHDILMKLMAKRPVERYQRPVELINDLVTLAEYEELPRSQSPGTYLALPAVSQRTLLETNLPWMVPIAFLLGSTLWLQSIQALSGQQRVPNFEAVTNVVGRNGPALPNQPSETSAVLPRGDAVVESGSDVGKGSVDAGVLVVSAVSPRDVDATLWENSLESALRRVELEPNIEVVEIRGAVVLRQPITLTQSRLTVRGNPLYGSALEIDPAVFSSTDESAAFLLEDSTLRFSNLSIVMSLPRASGLEQEPKSVIAMRGRTGAVYLESVSSTLDAGGRGEGLAIVDTRSGQRASLASLQVMSPRDVSRPGGILTNPVAAAWQPDLSPVPPVDNRFTLHVSGMSQIRGDGVLMRYEESQRLSRMDVVVQSSLIAMSDGALAVQASNGSAAPGVLRIECGESTFISRGQFAELNYSGEGQPQLGVNRISRSCVYYSETDTGHFLVRGARRQSLLGNFVLLNLEGQDNAYSSSITDLCEAFSGLTKVATFGFAEASLDGWFGERSDEFEVLWRQEFTSPLEFSRISADDVQLDSGIFQPGMPLSASGVE